MGTPPQKLRKSLDDGHHSRTKILVFDRGDHKLFYRLVGRSAELSKKLAMVEEVLRRLRDYAA
jgi:hypothetical protein